MIGRKFTRLIFSLLLLLAVIHDARADNATGRQQGRALATQQRATISGMFDEMPDNTTVPGYIGTTLPEGGYDSDTLGAADNATLNERATQAKETVFSQPRWDIEDGQLDAALAVQADPGEFHGLGDFLSGEYEACDPTIAMSGEPATEHFCDRWRPTEDSECTSTVGVTYGRDITYQCQRDTPDTYKKCDEFYEPMCRVSNHVGRLIGGTQTSGGLTRWHGISYKYDGSFHMGRYRYNPVIYIGNRSQRRYYNLITEFSIDDEDLNNTMHFTLSHVGWDDGVQISVNDNLVFSDGHGFGTASRSDQGRYRTKKPNIDVKEHLIAGTNTIKLRGYVVSAGQFHAIFTTSLCAEITGEWREVCEE